MYRIRVTTLEKFRRWKDEVSEYDSEESFIESLTGEFTGNAYTQIGTAFHSIVENGISVVRPYSGNIYCVVADNVPVYFDKSHIDIALAYKNEAPQALHEIRLFKTYPTKYGDVEITGCADIVNGLILRDIKTKYSPVKQQEYLDSCQWRFYLELFQLNDFIFDLFQFVGYTKEYGTNVSSLILERFEPIPCIRYATMEQDNRDLLDGFLDYIFSQNLQQYIMKEEQKAEQNVALLNIPADITNTIECYNRTITSATASTSQFKSIDSQNVKKATTVVNECKKVIKEIDKQVDELLRPYKDAKKEIDACQKKIKERAEEIKSELPDKVKKLETMIIAFTNSEKERVEREQKIAQVFISEGMEFDGVAYNGFGLSVPYVALTEMSNEELNATVKKIRRAKNASEPFTTSAPAPEQPTVAPPVVVPEKVKGLTTIRKYEIVDENLIPREYMSIDAAKINKAVKGGIAVIPGVRIYEEQQIKQTR